MLSLTPAHGHVAASHAALSGVGMCLRGVNKQRGKSHPLCSALGTGWLPWRPSRALPKRGVRSHRLQSVASPPSQHTHTLGSWLSHSKMESSMSRHKGEQGLDSPLGETNEGGSPSLRDPEIVKVAQPSLQPGRRHRQLELGTTGQNREGAELAWTGRLQLPPGTD